MAEPGSEPVSSAPKGTTMEQLLRPTGPIITGSDGQRYVQLGEPPGALRVRESLFENFKIAENYLAKSNEAVDTLYHLTHPAKNREGGKYPEPIEVIPTNSIDDDSFGTLGTPQIHWAPYSGMKTTGGDMQSPAMVLLHETGHAQEWQANPERSQRNSEPYKVDSPEGKTWTTAEEKRNIEGLENRVAKELGEGIRHDHAGEEMRTRGPASRDQATPAKDGPVHMGPGPVPVPAQGETIDHDPYNGKRPFALKMNGQQREDAIQTGGKITSASVSKAGIVTIEFETGGRKQTLQYRDPISKDEAGNDMPNPLHDLADLKPGDKFKLATDSKGQNAALTYQSADKGTADQRLGENAVKLFGDYGTRKIEADHAMAVGR